MNNDIITLAQQLRKAAKKATKGPWIAEREHFHNNGNLAGIYVDQGGKGRGGCVLECFSNCLVHPDSQVKNNALYVALANPVNISLILDALEAAQKRIAELEQQKQQWVGWAEQLGTKADTEQKRIAELETSQPVVPEGYCLMPLSLTAENGAKNALNGEFHTIEHIGCVACGGDGIDGDDECDNCDGSGDVVVQAPVSWTTIKDIYKAAVKCCSIQSFGNSEQLKAPALQDDE